MWETAGDLFRAAESFDHRRDTAGRAAGLWRRLERYKRAALSLAHADQFQELLHLCQEHGFRGWLPSYGLVKLDRHQDAAWALMDWLQLTLLKGHRADFEASRDHPSRKRLGFDGDFVRGIPGDDLEDASVELGQRVFEYCWASGQPALAGEGVAFVEAVVEKARGLIVGEANVERKRDFVEKWQKCMPLEKAQPLLTDLGLFDLLLSRLEGAGKRAKAAALASVMAEHQRAANQLQQLQDDFYKACCQQELLLAGAGQQDHWTALVLQPAKAADVLEAMEPEDKCMGCRALVMAKLYSYLMTQGSRALGIQACGDGLELLERLVKEDFTSPRGHEVNMPGLMYCLFQLPSIHADLDLDLPCAPDCILMPKTTARELIGEERHLGLQEVKKQDILRHARVRLADTLVGLLGQLSQMLPRRFDHFKDHLHVISLCQRVMRTCGHEKTLEETKQEAYNIRQEELTISLAVFETEGTWDGIQKPSHEEKQVLKLFGEFVRRSEFWDGDSRARWTSYFRALRLSDGGQGAEILESISTWHRWWSETLGDLATVLEDAVGEHLMVRCLMKLGRSKALVKWLKQKQRFADAAAVHSLTGGSSTDVIELLKQHESTEQVEEWILEQCMRRDADKLPSKPVSTGDPLHEMWLAWVAKSKGLDMSIEMCLREFMKSEGRPDPDSRWLRCGQLLAVLGQGSISALQAACKTVSSVLKQIQTKDPQKLAKYHAVLFPASLHQSFLQRYRYGICHSVQWAPSFDDSKKWTRQLENRESLRMGRVRTWKHPDLPELNHLEDGEDLQCYLSSLLAQLHTQWMELLLKVPEAHDGWWSCALSCASCAAEGEEIQTYRAKLAWHVYEKLVKPKCATTRFLQVLRELDIGKLAMGEAFKASAQQCNSKEDCVRLMAMSNSTRKILAQVEDVELCWDALKDETSLQEVLADSVRDGHDRHLLQFLDLYSQYHGSFLDAAPAFFAAASRESTPESRVAEADLTWGIKKLLDWPDTYRNRLGDLLRLRLFFEHSERRKGVGQEQALWTWLPVQLHNYRQEVEKIVNVDEMPFESRKKLRLKLQQTLGCGPELVADLLLRAVKWRSHLEDLVTAESWTLPHGPRCLVVFLEEIQQQIQHQKQQVVKRLKDMLHDAEARVQKTNKEKAKKAAEDEAKQAAEALEAAEKQLKQYEDKFEKNFSKLLGRESSVRGAPPHKAHDLLCSALVPKIGGASSLLRLSKFEDSWRLQRHEGDGRHAIAIEASLEYGLIQIKKSDILHYRDKRYKPGMMELLQARLLDDLRGSGQLSSNDTFRYLMALAMKPICKQSLFGGLAAILRYRLLSDPSSAADWCHRETLATQALYDFPSPTDLPSQVDDDLQYHQLDRCIHLAVAVDSAQGCKDLPFVREVFRRVQGQEEEATKCMKWHEAREPLKKDWERWKQWKDVHKKWQLHRGKFRFDEVRCKNVWASIQAGTINSERDRLARSNW